MPIDGKMRGAKLNSYLSKIGIVFFLVGVLTTTSAFSALTGTVTMQSYGTILSGSEITVQNSSARGIQAAVDAIAAVGGGTVYIPAGTFTFDVDLSHTCLDNGYAGVVVPGGVNVIGAGIGQTILSCSTPAPYGSDYTSNNNPTRSLFVLDGSNNKPIRISGFTLRGKVNTASGANDRQYLNGISAYGVKDFRIDHIAFIDLPWSGVSALNWYVANSEGNCGVIDHCSFDNPYKDTFYQLTGNLPYWAYGIMAGGHTSGWRSLSEVLGQYGPNIVYIEDNSFRRCRHAISGASEDKGWYVARHNTFTEMIVAGYGSYIDVHGGGRGCEVYANTITESPTDYRSTSNVADWGDYEGCGVGLRGGASVIFGNTFNNFTAAWSKAVSLSNDQTANTLWRLDKVWIWDNIYNNCYAQLTTAQATDPFTIIQNDEYFLRAPTQAQDGFTYTPYTYPHPLTK